MAQFYGSMTGSRGEATRCGTKNSGFSAHIRGWDIGAVIEMRHENGKDVCVVWITRGSNGNGSPVLLGRFVEGEVAP
jgi:hypothetical protein